MIDREKFFKEFDYHLLNDEKPSMYFNDIKKDEELKKCYPFSFIFDLINVDQNPKYHPEGTVWNHTMMVIDEAAQNKHLSKDKKIFMWASLLHDIGKTPTTKIRKGKITSYNHDKVGKGMSIKFLEEFNCSEDFIKEVSALVRWHMQPLFVVKDTRFAQIEDMLRDCSLKEIALLSKCDRLGRGNLNKARKEEEIDSIKLFIEKVKSYSCSK